MTEITNLVPLSILLTNYNTLDLIELSLTTLKNLTKNRYQVLINDNGSRASEIKRLKKLAQKNDNIWLNFQRLDNDNHSYCHGLALDLLIDKVETPYAVILDSDCVVLLKNWDEMLLAQLTDKVKIIGATSPAPRSGNRIGGGTFPLCFAVLFETAAYRQLETSCLPADIFIKGEDTCFRWPAAFKENGFEGKIFETRNTRDFPDGPFGHLTGVEEYYFDGKLIACHFGRGSKAGMGKFCKTFNLPGLSPWIKTILGAREKNMWKRKCREILKEQTSFGSGN